MAPQGRLFAMWGGERGVHPPGAAPPRSPPFARSTPLCLVGCDVLFACHFTCGILCENYLPISVCFYSISVVFCLFHVQCGTAKRCFYLASTISLFCRIYRLFGWFRWLIYSQENFLLSVIRVVWVSINCSFDINQTTLSAS